MKSLYRWAAATCLALAALAAGAQEIQAARVNGAGITVGEIEARFAETLKDKGMHLLQVRDPAKVKLMKRAALDTLIDEELLWQEARRNDAVVADARVDEAFALAAKAAKGEDRLRLKLAQEEISEADFRERIRRRLSGEDYAERATAEAAAVSDAEVHEFYGRNPDKFRRPEMLRARHILIRVAPDASRAERAAARRRIAAVLAESRAGKDFAELARTHSEDATKQWDGELDPFPRGTHAAEFEKAAFALDPGRVSGIVATPAGFHLIRVDQRIPAMSIAERDAAARIRAFLQAGRAQEARKKLLEDLRALANIEMRLPY